MSTIFEAHAYDVRKVDQEAPWRWLMAGWRDYRAKPGISIAYGAVFCLAGYFLSLGLFDVDAFYISALLATGFLLVGPLLAVGLYDISRRLEAGMPIRLADCCLACRKNKGQIALMGLALLMFMVVWVRVATLLFALFYTDTAPAMDDFILGTLLSGESLPFLIVGTLIGGVLALAAFSISAISVPMLLDRDVDALSAILTSVRAVRENWWTMWGWGCLIVLFTGAGLVTFYVGLVVTLPLVGYASWHAYRDLVVR